MLNLLSFITKKISFYYNVNDKVPHEMTHNIIYRITCPGCGGKYIGKTEDVWFHLWMSMKHETLGLFKHLSKCEMFKETCNLHAFPSLYNESDPNEISLTSHILSAVLQNHEILDFSYN